MRPECVKFVRDMLDAGQAIMEATKGKTRLDFHAERTLRDAVQWNFCVIGEALSQLRKLDPAAVSGVTDQAKIVGFRNQLIHGYGVVDHDITWDIVRTKLPVLMVELQRLLPT